MSRGKLKKITVRLPILPGTISTARGKCGKPNCICKAKFPKLHGPYYRWTGIINRRPTTVTISKETAEECIFRIKNYRKFKSKIKALVDDALHNAPWTRKLPQK